MGTKNPNASRIATATVSSVVAATSLIILVLALTGTLDPDQPDLSTASVTTTVTSRIAEEIKYREYYRTMTGKTL